MTYREKQHELARAGDAHYEDPEKRDRTANAVQGHIEAEHKNIEAWSKHNDPKIKLKYDYSLKTSPLTTMVNIGPDGKTRDYRAIRDATTSIVMLNKLSNDQATQALLKIGSPVGFDDKTQLPLTGYNGQRGAGGQNYKVIGQEIRGNVAIELSGGQKLRIPVQVLNDLETARMKGYELEKIWKKQQQENAKPSWLGRTLQTITGN
jgi:hypothetical protein